MTYQWLPLKLVAFVLYCIYECVLLAYDKLVGHNHVARPYRVGTLVGSDAVDCHATQ